MARELVARELAGTDDDLLSGRQCGAGEAARLMETTPSRYRTRRPE